MSTSLTEFEYEDRILDSLRKRDGAVTVGDVAADTGLPMEETEQAMRRMLSLYKSHLDVDDDGNLRYRFDPSFVRRGEEPGRLWHRFKQGLWTAFKWFFKVWIMVMLVGYTVIFILLLLALAVAGIAAASQGDSDRGGGRMIMLPFYALARLLEFLFWISLFDDSRSMGRGIGRRRGGRLKRKKPKPEKPFYQKVFDFVFGPESESDPMGMQKAFARFVRKRDGRVTAAEWASRTGQSLDEAENALTASLVRFNGDVDVNEDGVLVYRFDQLRMTADEEQAGGSDLKPIWLKRMTVPKLTGNPSSTNWWISIFNGFNLGMSIFVLTSVVGTAGLHPAVPIGLGWVPLVFSSIFFLVPFLRWIGSKFEESKAEKENERRQQIGKIFRAAEQRQSPQVELDDRFADELAVDYDGDVRVSDDGRVFYFFDTVSAELDAAEKAREAAHDHVVFGQTVFSSDEEEVSMEEAELAEFDRRLERELGGESFDVGVEQKATVSS